MQSEHLAPCLGSHGNTIGDGMPQQWIHRVVAHRIRGQTAVIGVPFQQALAFLVDIDGTGEPVLFDADGLDQYSIEAF